MVRAELLGHLETLRILIEADHDHLRRTRRLEGLHMKEADGAGADDGHRFGQLRLEVLEGADGQVDRFRRRRRRSWRPNQAP